MTRALIVEDNQDMRHELSRFLKQQGMTVMDVASTEEGIDAVDENSFDIGIIDINLPGKSGYDMIEYIREQGEQIPLIAMTARDKVEDKIKGFDLGLTDYIVKPFDLEELLARMNAHLRDAGSISSSRVIKLGNLSLNPKKIEFKRADKIIDLTNIEFRILHMLMSSANTLVPVDDLIEFAWGEESDMINPPIRIHIANLRKKIGDKDFQIIRTVPGRGYIFNTEEVG